MEQIKELVGLLPIEIGEKAFRYRRWQDGYGHIFGKLLLKIALRRMHFSDDLHALRYTSERKPFIPGGPFFNLSHSGCRVICAINAARNIGVDIEQATDPIAITDFQHLFTPAEWTAICDSPSSQLQFYHFWTAKESLIKGDGRGLAIPLQEIDISANRPILFGNSVWAVVRLAGMEGYSGHLAVEVPPSSIDPFSPGKIPGTFTDVDTCELSPEEIYRELIDQSS
jgi:4'-phosphopantetheinyl transferase